MSNPEDICSACHRGEMGPQGFGEEVEMLATLETMMQCGCVQCGCGGYVSHSLFHCPVCGRFFLTAFEDHWPPSSADVYLFEIDQGQAQAMLAALQACPDLDNRDCGCPVHQASERWHNGVRGVRRYYRAYEQSWDE